MVYKIKLSLDGKKEEFKRTEPPFLKDITRALILNQHQGTMYEDPTDIPDKRFMQNQADVAKFAVAFWNSQFTEENFINGADAQAMTAYGEAYNDCLGVKPDDTEEKEDTKK
ncbi:phage tail assembly chaperone G [Companilactobacillus mishanensis]|uniref:Phage tail protein n=1 Tax=Companilactobacillus mishanensis TaxID=2486008 RepID=A0A5P0ZGI8_9LACO|nr:hypothetical protein [Companilactobacillus mishanensis]MQS52173.1 hypothetical protein [Companilactobacillus mishanensis]